MGARAKSDQYCGLLRNRKGVFGECIDSGRVDFEDAFESCLMDVCAYQDDPRASKAVACESLENMAEECAEEGFVHQWRTRKRCRK